MQLLGVRQSALETQRAGLTAVRRRHDDESHTAMNRKDSLAIVETKPGVDRRTIEQVPAQRRTAAIGGDARRQQQADATAAPDEAQRPFDEQLISIGMAGSLVAIEASAPEELQR